MHIGMFASKNKVFRIDVKYTFNCTPEDKEIHFP